MGVDIFGGIGEALAALASVSVLLFFLLGCVNGLIFGLLPGLSGSVGIALMIPLTFGMGASEAMVLFVAALSGQTFAGSITAILLNTPGTSPNAATTFDGYPLARQGKGGYAVGVSAAASAAGSAIGVVLLVVLLPVIRQVILSFSFPEFMMLGVLGLAAIALASRGSLIKGLMSGALGLILSFVGFAPIGGDLRYVFQISSLTSGVDVIAVLIGVFALAEVTRLLVDQERISADLDALRFSKRQVFQGVRYVFTQPMLLLRSSLLGTGLGIIPAVGGTVASFLAYFGAYRGAKDNELFGHGDSRGVLAPEAANDAKDAGAALPSLAFGLPGSADWAIILGAMIMHGVTPGPNLIRERPDIVWIAVIVILLASWLTSAIGVVAAPYLVQVTRLRASVLAPIVGVLSVTGAFGLQRQLVDVYVAVAFGVLGYFMRRHSVPVIPLILGLILGAGMERAFLQTLSVFGGPAAFVTRPISLGLLLLTVALLGWEVIAARRRRQTATAAVREAPAWGSVAVVALFLVVGAVAVSLAYDFRPDSRAFPLLAGWTLIVLSSVYLAVGLIPGLRRRLGGLIADTGAMDQLSGGVAQRQPSSGPEGQEASVDGDGADDTDAEPGGPSVQTQSSEQEHQESEVRRRRTAVMVALLILLGVGVWLVGLPVIIPLFMLLVMKGVADESWPVTLGVIVGTVGLLYVVFSVVLQVPLEGGLLVPF